MKKKKLKLFFTAEEYALLDAALDEYCRSCNRFDLEKIYAKADKLRRKTEAQVFLQGGCVL